MGLPTSEIKGSVMIYTKFFQHLSWLTNLLREGALRVTIQILMTVMIAAAPLQPAFAASPPVLMVLGDSLVAGHGLPQGEAFPDVLGRMLERDGIAVTTVNSGVSGDTTAGGLARLDWSLASAPDAAVVVLGGNDLLRGLEPSASYANLEAIIERLKARNVEVLLAGMQAPRNLGADYANEFDAIYQKLAQRHDILFYPFFLDGVALQPEMNLSDGMHPNQRGITHIAAKILPQAKALLAKAQQARASR